MTSRRRQRRSTRHSRKLSQSPHHRPQMGCKIHTRESPATSQSLWPRASTKRKPQGSSLPHPGEPTEGPSRFRAFQALSNAPAKGAADASRTSSTLSAAAYLTPSATHFHVEYAKTHRKRLLHSLATQTASAALPRSQTPPSALEALRTRERKSFHGSQPSQNAPSFHVGPTRACRKKFPWE